MIQNETIENECCRSLSILCKTYALYNMGIDEDELINLAGQCIAYLPHCTVRLLKKIIQSWPTKSQAQVFYIRIVARIMMSCPRLDTMGHLTLHVLVSKKLSACMISTHVQLATEAQAFVCSPYMLHSYVAVFPELYTLFAGALDTVERSHWNSIVRERAQDYFDTILDFAP